MTKYGTEYVEEKPGIRITKVVMNESEDNDGTPKLTDKGSEKMLKEIISIQSNAEEKWTCDLREKEQSPKNNYFFSTVSIVLNVLIQLTKTNK